MAIAIVKRKIKCFLLHPNHSELFVYYIVKRTLHFSAVSCNISIVYDPFLYETTDEKWPRNMTFQRMLL